MSQPSLSAIQQYMLALTTPAGATRALREANQASASTTDYVYAYDESDRSYDSSEYPQAGVFSATTAPWFNSLSTVPVNWQWTAEDSHSAGVRGDQVNSENAYIQKNVPGTQYTGTAAEQIQARYSQNMWDPSVFSSDYTERLTSHWIADDAEFARQRLGAANPDVIARYTGSADDLANWLEASAGVANRSALLAQLQAAQQANQLFACDYQPVLGNVIEQHLVRNGQTLCAPLVLFTVSNGTLLPAAIQLDPAKQGYVFTPADDANSWLLAKLWAANADAQWWFSGTHLFNAHTVTMLFATAALNQMQAGVLPDTHNILVLLYPHIQKVFNINNAVYDFDNHTGIYQKGSFCDQFLPTGRIGLYQIIHNLYQGFSIDAAAFNQQLQHRGIDAASLPVSFPYRDDGQVWWDAISQFVGDIVDASYASDADVANDAALNGWMLLAQHAFNQDGVIRMTWQANKTYLKQLATNVFFTGSVQHTAVNNTMLPGLGFLPNGAFAMNGPLPTGPNVSDATLLAALPDPQAVSEGQVAWPIQNQINFVMNGTSAVSDVAAGDGSLTSLNTTYPYPTGSKQAQAVADFHSALWDGASSVTTRIQAQQDQRAATYHEANPGAASIPNSVRYVYLTPSNVLAVQQGSTSAVMNCIQI